MGIKEACVQRFKILCESRKISYNELANRAGVTPSTVYSMMDASRKDLSVLTIQHLCEGLGITIGDFFNHELFENIDEE